MICPYFQVQSLHDATPLLTTLSARSNPADAAANNQRTEATVQSILQSVQQNGLKAVIDYTRQFDAPEFTEAMFQVSHKDIVHAANSISPDECAILEQAAANIRCFHENQKEQSWFITKDDGTVLGQRVTPCDRAGLYVPGGKGGSTPLISSMLMNAIPAQVAGVAGIAVVSPPQPDGTVNAYILAAAHLLGITEVYAAGSAWGIAALAYGAGPLAPVDVIAGPGNIFVATAKRLLIGTVGIDMIAGPSEILIIADASANPSWIAADMLSQAEHDTLASSVCICTDKNLAAAIQSELEQQCKTLPRHAIAQESLEKFGAILYTPSMETAADIANAIAPEHLELLVEDPWSIVPKIKHAGAIFMGHYSAEALGDYFAGPNHVLPTMSTARFSSALSVSTFCKKSSIIAASSQFAKKHADATAAFARLEGLEAHARSALCRK